MSRPVAKGADRSGHGAASVTVIDPALLDRAAQDNPLERLAALADLGQQFASSLSIDETLRHVVRQIAGYMKAEAASVFLLTEGGGELECRSCAGPVDVTGLKLPFGQGIVGRTAAKNRSELIADVAADPDFAGTVDEASGFVTRSMLTAPLRGRDGVIGVLQVLNKTAGGHFDEGDRDALRVLASPVTLAVNNARMAADLVEQQRLKKELSLARRMQRSLLPRGANKDFPLAGINLPARQVSGDFFDYFRLPDGRIGFTIGDVAGKGMNASLLMVRTSTLLRWIGKTAMAPGQWLAAVNNELLETVSDGMFVCAVAGYFDPAQGTLVWANAGFPAPLLRTADGAYQSVPAQSPPLGVIEQRTSLPEQQALLAEEDCLYLFSDGVLEARDETGQMLGDEGLQALIDAHANLPRRVRLGALVNQLRGQSLGDDTTLLLLERADDG